MILTHISRSIFGLVTSHVINRRSSVSQWGYGCCWILMSMSVTFGAQQSIWAECSPWESTPRLGGPADAVVNVQEADRWRRYRAQREAERRLEARSPKRGRRRYRIEHTQITDGCITTDQLVDLGRNLFLRRFSRAEGYGHGIKSLPSRSRFQRGHFGGPDASACVDCHWKGGFAGAGDRVDNTYAFGDGEHLAVADPRNPPPLWGVGWVQLVAEEMSNDLQEIKRDLIERAREEGQTLTAPLVTKGVDFGVLKASPDGTLDLEGIEGVDGDLIVKPFGWKGTFSSLREFVEVSAHKHLGMQSERLVAAPYKEVELGESFDITDHEGPPEEAPPHRDPADPDQDHVVRELTEGQVIALVAFLATLDTPQVEIPVRGVYQIPPRTGTLEFVDSPAFADRWLKGARLFEEVGCSECHRPYLPLKRAHLKIPMYGVSPRGSTPNGVIELDLSAHAALPHPEREREDGGAGYSVWLVPVFSDFKRHKMGEHLQAKHIERGVARDEYITRRLWGARKTTPYLHHGGALSFTEAILAHGGEGSEAMIAVEQFKALNEDEKSSLRLFLASLSRGPAIRIR